MVQLDHHDIQGNILVSYNPNLAAYRFFTIPNPTSGRAFLAALIDKITDAAPREANSTPSITTNVAVTYSGLAALGVPESTDRAPVVLGDTAASAPERWDQGLGTEYSHILVMTYGKTAADTDIWKAAVDTVMGLAKQCGLTVIHRQNAKALDSQREHFGWADGFGQPLIEGVAPPNPAQNPWPALKAGEFIHGYPDEDDQTVSGPAAALLHNSTYMVYRKLHQNVALFRCQLNAEADRYAENVHPQPAPTHTQLIELVAAKIVGRWRDGLPIEQPRDLTHITKPLVEEASPDAQANNFNYAGDLNGRRCPLGAHIRRTNPRDSLEVSDPATRGDTMTRRHRILRRGMPYGDPLPIDSTENDGKDRGLIFICFNAALDRQFEFVQSQWCNDGNAFGLGAQKDYLLGDNDGTGIATIQGDPPHIMRVPQDVVTTRGTEYLLMPGIRALKALATD
jgi:Dyp-type peroxidase family